jgi:hypothetical protein
MKDVASLAMRSQQLCLKVTKTSLKFFSGMERTQTRTAAFSEGLLWQQQQRATNPLWKLFWNQEQALPISSVTETLCLLQFKMAMKGSFGY